MENARSKYILNYIFCFITGFAILGMEMTLLKLIVPYSGEDIFSASIIINGILLALAIGYWLGGKFLDWHPGLLSIFSAFYFSISGLLYHPFGTLLINLKSPYLTTAGIVLVLFFIPLIILGTVTPIVAERFKKMGTGKAAGYVYAVGTLGSIVGGLITTFIIMPNLGVQGTIVFSTVLLLIAGIIIDFSYIKTIKNKLMLAVFIFVILIILTAGVVFANECKYTKYGTCLYSAETSYGSYVVIQKNSMKYLMQNRQMQSMAINAVTNKTNNYYDEFVNFDFVSEDNVLILGNSVGIMMTLINQKNPNVAITGVEIDPALTKIGEDWFSLRLNENTSIINKDARIFLYDNNDKYSYIFIDLYQGGNIPDHVLTAEFFDEVKKNLKENGIVAINVPNYINKNNSNGKKFRDVYFNTITSVFDYCTYKEKGHILICSSENNELLQNNNYNQIHSSAYGIFSDNFPADILQTRADYSDG